MAHEFGCSMLCWLKPALGIEFIIIFRFFVSRLNDEFPCLHFGRLFFVFTQKAIEKVSPVFKMLFVIKNANRKTIFRVFLNTLLPAIPYATQLDLRFEKHMPCYVHRTQILNLTSAKGKLWGNLQTTSRQLKWRIRRSTSHESFSLPPAETRTKKYIYWGCHFLSNSTG